MPSLISELITCMVSSQREQPRPERPGLGDCNRRQEQLWFLWLGETVQESNFKSSVLDSVRVDNKRERFYLKPHCLNRRYAAGGSWESVGWVPFTESWTLLCLLRTHP